MVNLEKGQNIVLNDLQQAGDLLRLGLDWDKEESEDIDIDISAFLLKSDDKIRTNSDFIFYNQLSDPDGCITLFSDSNSESFKQFFDVCLSKIPSDIAKIMFVLTVDQTLERNQCVQMIENLSMKVFDGGDEIIHYDITAHNEESSLMVASLYRHQGRWKLKAIGQGFSRGLDAIADLYNVNLDELSEKISTEQTETGITDETENEKPSSFKRRSRTSPTQMLRKHTATLLKDFKKILPTIYDSRDKRINESNTRMVLDKIFIELLGYQLHEVKAEQEIQGRRADYVLSVNAEDVIVVEVKKAGMPLKEKQIFQATSYGAYSGMEWVLLTNLVEWQVYHVSVQDKVESDLVFSVDLSDGISQEEAEWMVLISRYGMTRRTLLEKEFMRVNALSENSIMRSIMTEDVITKIRQVIKRDNGVTLTNEQVKASLETMLNLS